MNKRETHTETASNPKIHRRFKLNGMAFSPEELKEVAYNLIKEGKPFEKSIGDFLMDWFDDSKTVEVNTSGSTGKPKRIKLKKRHMTNSALATGEFFGLCPGDSALLCLPTDYIAGKMMLVRAMVLGLELDCVEPTSNPLATVPYTERKIARYDFCAMVPLQVENAIDTLDTIKILIVGGAPLSNSLRDRLIFEVKQTKIYETYGMTETITHVAVKAVVRTSVKAVYSTIENRNKSQTADELKKYAETEGRDTSFVALPQVSFSMDERGCLVIDAPKITDHPVVTNDMVNLLSKTAFVWLGRYDNVINSGGLKLFPEEIESRFDSVIAGRFFVVGIPDESLGQKLALLVEGKVDKAKLLSKIRDLPGIKKFEIPKEIYQLPEFSMTASGKIQRNKTLALVVN